MQNAFAGAGKLAYSSFIDGWKGWGRLVDAVVHMDKQALMGSPEDLAQLDKQQKEIFNKYAIFRDGDSDNSLFNKQFFGDMVQQSGFALGAIGQVVSEELLTMGASSFLKPLTGASQVARLLRSGITTEELLKNAKNVGEFWKNTSLVNKMYETLKGANQVTKFVPILGNAVETGMELAKAGKAGANAMELTGLTVNGLRRMISETNAAFSESRMEAAGTYADLKDSLYQKTMMEKGSVTFEDQQRIENLAQHAAWSNFKVNAGVISMMNRIEFDNVFRSFGADKRLFGKMAEEGEKEAMEVMGRSSRDITNEAGDVIVKKGDSLKKVYDKGTFGTIGNVPEIARDFGRKTAAWEAGKSLLRNTFKWEVAEGVQELIQEGSNQTMQDYYTDLYNGKTGDWGKSVKKGAQSQVNMQGLKTFLMGAVTGRLMAPLNFAVGHVANRVTTSAEDRNKEKATRQELINTVNAFYQDPKNFAPEIIANLKVQNATAAKMEAALRSNNKYAFENAKDSSFAKTVMAAKKLNMVASLTDTIRSYGEHFTDQEFKEAFMVDFNDENRHNVKKFTNEIADSIDKFSKRYDELKEEYSDLIRPELYDEKDQPRVLLAKRALEDSIEWMATNEYRAGRAAQRGIEILGKVSNIPTAAKSAHVAFRVLGHDQATEGEINMLQQDIKADRAAIPSADIAKRIAAKERQLAALEGFRDNLKKFNELEENDPAVVDSMMKHLGDYINEKNVEFNSDVKVSPKDLNDLFYRLTDYRKLTKDEHSFMDAFSLVANPKKFMGIYARVSEGLESLKQQKIAEAVKEILKAGAETKTSADGPPPAGNEGTGNGGNGSGGNDQSGEGGDNSTHNDHVYTKKDISKISEGTTLVKQGDVALDETLITSKFNKGDAITFYAEKERTGTWDGQYIREDGTNNPWGVTGILTSADGWIRNDTQAAGTERTAG
jgi:hypothetical protein